MMLAGGMPGSISDLVSEWARSAGDALTGLRLPAREQFLDAAAGLSQVQAVGLVLLGAAFLIFGYRWFKAFVIINAAILGAVAGAWLGSILSDARNMPLTCGIGGAIVLGLLAWPLLRYAVALMASAAGAVAGFWAWQAIAAACGQNDLARHAWIGALVGLLLAGALAFLVFRAAVMLFTAVQGSLLAVAGVLALMISFGLLSPPLRQSLQREPYLLPAILAVPALLGFFVQSRGLPRKTEEKKNDQ